MTAREKSIDRMRETAYSGLDPQAEALLSLMAGSVTESIQSMPLPLLRILVNETMKAFSGRHAAAAACQDFTIHAPTNAIPVRLYIPADAPPGPMPGLVYFHGGAFLAGNLDTHNGLCRALSVESQIRVLSVDYRLAPEHKFPAAVDDALAATSWISTNANELGLIPDRLAVGGDSAGATLAAVVAHLACSAGQPAIAAQILLYPLTQLDADTNSRRTLSRPFLLEEQVLRRCAEIYLGPHGDPRDARVSPLLSDDFSRLPAAVIVTAGLDPLRDEADAYAQRLRAARVNVDRFDYASMFHGFLSACGVLDAAQRALREIAAALRERLR